MEAKELAWGFESPFILTLSTFTGAHLLCTFTTADADVFARAGYGNKGLIIIKNMSTFSFPMEKK
ncbi:MAG: hypothetical protein IJ941_04665, partial [Clostridia bacterium]|nr:hypothetical protein [Clostridia bacterium]